MFLLVVVVMLFWSMVSVMHAKVPMCAFGKNISIFIYLIYPYTPLLD